MTKMYLEVSASSKGSYWKQGRMRTAADDRSTQDFVTDLIGAPKSWQLEAVLSLGMPAEPSEHRKFDDTLMEKVRIGDVRTQASTARDWQPKSPLLGIMIDETETAPNKHHSARTSPLYARHSRR